MPADYERAVSFILAHGSGVELHALNELEGGDRYEVPSDSVVEQQLLDGQRPDGGWAPFWAADYSSLDATCYRLAQFERAWIPSWLPQTALEFLRSRQRPDGSWEEDESVRDLAPPWTKPGDLAARLYVTANCGWWLINGMAHGAQGYEDEAARAGAYRILSSILLLMALCLRSCKPIGSPPPCGFAWNGVSQICRNKPSAR